MKVKITNLAKSPMQSGSGKNKLWLLTVIEDESTRSVNELTGWTSSSDTRMQLKLKFNNKEDAIIYAKGKNYQYVVDEANESIIKPKSYAQNFTAPILNS